MPPAVSTASKWSWEPLKSFKSLGFNLDNTFSSKLTEVVKLSQLSSFNQNNLITRSNVQNAEMTNQSNFIIIEFLFNCVNMILGVSYAGDQRPAITHEWWLVNNLMSGWMIITTRPLAVWLPQVHAFAVQYLKSLILLLSALQYGNSPQ